MNQIAIPSVSGFLNQAITWLVSNWYIVLIGLMLIALVLAIMSILKYKSKQVQYWDQIEENKKLITRELKYNPDVIKKIQHFGMKYKVYGHSLMGGMIHKKPDVKQKTFRTFTLNEIRNMEIENIKVATKSKEAPDFILHKFLIKRNNFLGIYLGKSEILLLLDREITQIKSNTYRIEDGVGLIWRKGFLSTHAPEMIEIVDELTERLMADHYVNARGQQMKDFSRIRTDYAHIEKMKDKDIELEEKKEKTKRFG